MSLQNDVTSRCPTCGSGIALRDGRATCAHDDRHGIAMGGPGSGWHAEQGHVPGSQGGNHLKPANESTDMPAATADPFSAPPNAGRTDVRIVNNDSPNKAERLAVTKAHVKTLHAQLKREGFVRGLPQVSVSKSEKLGRSSAYGGGRRDTKTPYTHPDGRQALMRVGIPNAGPHTISVIHGASES